LLQFFPINFILLYSQTSAHNNVQKDKVLYEYTVSSDLRNYIGIVQSWTKAAELSFFIISE
jgi:hypothetical protein